MNLSTKDAANVWKDGSSELFNWTESGTSSNFSNSTGNRTEIGVVDLTRAIPLGMVLGTFITAAVVGNILVILSVVCNRNLRTATNYFIINLAIADLLLSSIVLPVSATLEILDYWVFGRIFCDIWAAMDVLCCTASIMSLCVISIDRYIGVSYPLRYPGIVTKKRALLAMLGVWILSLVIAIGPLIGWKQPPSADDTVCLITEEPFYALFSSFCSFYIPLGVILTMYCRVYVVAKRTTKNLEAGVMREKNAGESSALRIHRGRQQVQEDTGDAPAKKQSSLMLKLMKFSQEKKAAKTLGVVVGMFTLCWLPFFLSLPIGSFNVNLRPPETLFKVLFWLGYFNSCLNPIIYPLYSNEFKQAFLRILRCQWGNRQCAAWQAYNRCSYLSCSGYSRKGSAEPHPRLPEKGAGKMGRGRNAPQPQRNAVQTSPSALLPGAPTDCLLGTLKEEVGVRGGHGGTGGRETSGGLHAFRQNEEREAEEGGGGTPEDKV